MKDIIIFDAYYLPAFFQVLLMSLGVWALVRIFYQPLLLKLKVWHPSLCDFCLLVIIFNTTLNLYRVQL